MQNSRVLYSNNQTIKFYNPNSFNARDSALAFILVVVGFFLLPLIFEFININNNDVLYILSMFLTQGFILLLALLFFKIRRVSPLVGGYCFHEKFKRKDLLMSCLLIISLMILFIPLTEKFVYGFGNPSVDEILLSDGVILFTIFVLIPVLPAICEELLFRGVILRGLLEFGKFKAILISAILFSIMHGSYQQTIFQFIIGFAIGYVVVETKSLFIGMIMHFLNNLFSTIYSIMESLASQLGIYSIFNAFAIIAGIVLIFIVFIHFFNRNNPKKQVEPPKENIALGQTSFSDFSKAFKNYEKHTPAYLATNSNTNKLSSFMPNLKINPQPPRPENVPSNFFYHEKFGWIKQTKRANSTVSIILLVLGLAIASIIWVLTTLSMLY